MGKCEGKTYVTSHVQAAFHDRLGFSTGDVQTKRFLMDCLHALCAALP